MNLTNTMRVIGRHKALLFVGILVALLAAFAAMFRVETLTLTPRVEQQYRAATQLLVSDPTSEFSTKSAPQPVVDGQTPPAARDLAAMTVVYAYLVQSNEIQKQVEAKLGPLASTEDISAQQRTTQPTSTTNTGTYKLPVLEIDGTSTSPSRAQQISRAATTAFQAFAAAQQDSAEVPSEQRVQLQVIRSAKAEVVDGTNPVLPVVAVGVGVLIAFLALIFAVDNAAATRSAKPAKVAKGKKASKSAGTVAAPAPASAPMRPASAEQPAARVPEPAMASTAAGAGAGAQYDSFYRIIDPAGEDRP